MFGRREKFVNYPIMDTGRLIFGKGEEVGRKESFLPLEFSLFYIHYDS